MYFCARVCMCVQFNGISTTIARSEARNPSVKMSADFYGRIVAWRWWPNVVYCTMPIEFRNVSAISLDGKHCPKASSNSDCLVTDDEKSSNDSFASLSRSILRSTMSTSSRTPSSGSSSCGCFTRQFLKYGRSNCYSLLLYVQVNKLRTTVNLSRLNISSFVTNPSPFRSYMANVYLIRSSCEPFSNTDSPVIHSSSCMTPLFRWSKKQNIRSVNISSVVMPNSFCNNSLNINRSKP